MLSRIGKTRVAFALLGGAIVLMVLGGDPLRELLRYERAALPFAQAWRWLSAHLVHLGLGHAVLNGAGLILIYLLFGKALDWRSWVFVFAISVASIDLGFWFGNPTLVWYVGLSGVLHGLFAAGALNEALGRRREGILLLVGLVAKLGYEQLVGALPLTAESAGGPVIVDAHLYGALGGALACVLIRMWPRGRQATEVDQAS